MHGFKKMQQNSFIKNMTGTENLTWDAFYRIIFDKRKLFYSQVYKLYAYVAH